MTEKERIYQFLEQHQFAVLATASVDGKTEAATLEYAIDGDDLLINTYKSYRKYPNMVGNPHVSLVVTDGDMTLQIDGQCQLVNDADRPAARAAMVAVYPTYGKYYDNPETVFFRITPTWMRLGDHSQFPVPHWHYPTQN